MIPMAGLGSRFAQAGYQTPKPLLPVSGRPMVVQAARDLPPGQQVVFILRTAMPGREHIEREIQQAFPHVRFVRLDHPTDGQARTCMLAMADVDPDALLTIGACDNGLIYAPERYQTLLDDPGVDVIVWAMRGHPGAARQPHMYGWIDAPGGKIRAISVKVPLSDPTLDPIIVGAFTFKKGRHFTAAAERMFARQGLVNGEYYVDTCINDALALGLICHILEVTAYPCWGTPDDLLTFEYWQSCFQKRPTHPYSLEKDQRIPASARTELAEKYRPQLMLPPVS
ncbi:MAG: NTP transferase domain-containing protein [Magnetococcus sp. DMHC-1]